MADNESKLSRTCIDIMHSEKEREQCDALVEMSLLSSSEIIELLAHYQYVSDSDDDDIIDPWLDSLNQAQKKILQAFELARGRIEQNH